MGTFNFNHRLHERFEILLKNFHVISFVNIYTYFSVYNSRVLLQEKEYVVYSYQYVMLLRGLTRFGYRTGTVIG